MSPPPARGLPATHAVNAPRSAWVGKLSIPGGLAHEVVASGSTTMRSLYFERGQGPTGWTGIQPVAVGPLLTQLIHQLATGVLPARVRAEAVLMDLLEPVPVATLDVPLPRDGRARDVAQALLNDPADHRTLAEWGRTVGAGARTLLRTFAADTGVPFGRWRTSLRLSAALPYLAAGEPVGRVASLVGYDTPSAFVAFRRETGLTPGAYFRTPPRGE
ncbi:AraC family transcriptional regulator [Streptomyces sp. So13.3]|uniref:AraC family transcriptional regulator n=1 Tax=Streptomyces sp. So13.3 TaxID=2136173 RepID=UPI001FD48E70|nr:AraC family transcriptional regulator [Streptomyces sp. So13.3]